MGHGWNDAVEGAARLLGGAGRGNVGVAGRHGARGAAGDEDAAPR